MKSSSIGFIIIISFMITLVVVYTVLWLIFTFYRFSISLCLHYQHGHKYVGLLDAQDSMMECTSSKVVIHIAIAVNHTNLDDLTKCVKHSMKRAEESCIKLTYKTKNFGGYTYYLRTSSEHNDPKVSLVKYNEEEVISGKCFVKFLNESFVGKDILGQNMWHATILKQPVLWNSSGNVQNFVIISIRHCIADGVAILGFIKNKILTDLDLPSVRGRALPKQQEERLIPYVYRNPLKQYDHGFKEQFESKEFLAVFIEDEVKYTNVTRYIKHTLNVSFNAPLITAMALATSTYLRKKNLDVNTLTGSVNVRPFIENVRKLFTGNCDYNKVSNTSTSVLVDILNNISDKGNKNIDKVFEVDTITKRTFKGAEVLLSNTVEKTVWPFPHPILRFLGNSYTDSCFDISNVYGMQTNGILEKFFFFTSQCLKLRLSFSLITVDYRWQVTLKSAPGVVETQEELEEILGDVFKFLDELYEDVKMNN